MNKEGYSTVAGFFLFSLILLFTGIHYQNIVIFVLAVISFLLTILSVYFFRDPARKAVDDPYAIFSPADGKVIDISTVNEPLFFESRVTRISIFLSLFDVHVNYIPFSGSVEYLTYNRGKYYHAHTSAASSHNVHSFVGLETKYGKLAFKQMTGMVARRIVCNLVLGDTVKAGDKFGIIKFGSRMEVFLPESASPTVKLGDRLRAAESVIAKIHDTK